jgi:hypothetical protein
MFDEHERETDTEALLVRWEREWQERLQGCKTTLKNLLAQEQNIAKVEADYNGCGDSGQIDSVRFLNKGGDPVEPTREGIPEAVEALIFFLLAQSHGGWEINEGSYGSVTIDAETLTGILEHTHRIEEWSETEF